MDEQNQPPELSIPAENIPDLIRDLSAGPMTRDRVIARMLEAKQARPPETQSLLDLPGVGGED